MTATIENPQADTGQESDGPLVAPAEMPANESVNGANQPDESAGENETPEQPSPAEGDVSDSAESDSVNEPSASAADDASDGDSQSESVGIDAPEVYEAPEGTKYGLKTMADKKVGITNSGDVVFFVYNDLQAAKRARRFMRRNDMPPMTKAAGYARTETLWKPSGEARPRYGKGRSAASPAAAATPVASITPATTTSSAVAENDAPPSTPEAADTSVSAEQKKATLAAIAGSSELREFVGTLSKNARTYANKCLRYMGGDDSALPDSKQAASIGSKLAGQIRDRISAYSADPIWVARSADLSA